MVYITFFKTKWIQRLGLMPDELHEASLYSSHETTHEVCGISSRIIQKSVTQNNLAMISDISLVKHNKAPSNSIISARMQISKSEPPHQNNLNGGQSKSGP